MDVICAWSHSYAYPISVPHAVDVVFQFFQLGGEVGEAAESRAQVQRAPTAAAAEFTPEEVGRRRPTGLSKRKGARLNEFNSSLRFSTKCRVGDTSFRENEMHFTNV